MANGSVAETFRFVDLFSGVGGFHLGMNAVGGKCVMACEINKHARASYEKNFKGKEPGLFKGMFPNDITKVEADKVPDFNVLCAGFPCQPFSQAGKKRGFEDARGTLFFDVARIAKEKAPDVLFLENVRHFVAHDGGRTFARIKGIVEDLGYSFHWKIIRASDHNLPQHRARVYMVCFKDPKTEFSFPQARPLTMTMSKVLGGVCPRDIGFTLRCGGRGSGISDRRNWDSYAVGEGQVKLTVEQGKAMMGFPSGYKFPVSERQAMRQLGNAVAVNVISDIGERIVEAMKWGKTAQGPADAAKE